MNPWTASLLVLVGMAEWGIATRRQIAAVRGELALLFGLVAFEQLLGLWVLVEVVKNSCWTLALCYALGSGAGAVCGALAARR